MCFHDPSTGYLGAGGRLYRTTTGGRSWQPVPTGLRRSQNAGADVQCAGGHAGCAELLGPGAASSQSPHLGFRLHNGHAKPVFAEQYFPHPGVTVSRGSPGNNAGSFSAVSASRAVYVDWCSACGLGTAPLAVAVGGGSRLLRRGDVRGLTFPTGVSFASGSDGWVIGSAQLSASDTTEVYRIVHTTDGGRNWRTQKTITPSS